jgi:hypothetical protein
MYHGVKLRSALNGDQSVVHDFEELRAQSPALLLVPNKRIFDIRRGSRTDNDLH